MDVDFVSTCLWTSAVNRTYGSIAARSFHPSRDQGLLLNGSVRVFSGNFDLTNQSALGTRGGRGDRQDSELYKGWIPGLALALSYSKGTRVRCVANIELNFPEWSGGSGHVSPW